MATAGPALESALAGRGAGAADYAQAHACTVVNLDIGGGTTNIARFTIGVLTDTERDERRFDFHDIGLAIKRAREASGMTQEQLAYIVDRAPRTIMYNENDGQHPSFNTFYQMVTMFDISVDQYFYPSQNSGSECRKRIDAMLNALDERELKIVEATIQAMKASKETEET